MPNTHRRRRRDATLQLRRVGVGGVYWALACNCGHGSKCPDDRSVSRHFGTESEVFRAWILDPECPGTECPVTVSNSCFSWLLQLLRALTLYQSPHTIFYL